MKSGFFVISQSYKTKKRLRIAPISIIFSISGFFAKIYWKHWLRKYIRPYRNKFHKSCTHFTDVGDGLFKCFCGATFKSKWYLLRHKKTHIGGSSFTCEICSKEFSTQQHLDRHHNTHIPASEKQLFQCDVPGCHNKYSRKDNLYHHQLRSHGIRRQRNVSAFSPHKYWVYSNDSSF